MTMTDEELERLKRRFGEDLSAWPAPYQKLLKGVQDEDALDRLVREAAVADVNDDRLVYKFLEGLQVERGIGWIPFWPLFASPRFAVAAGFSLVVTAMTAGYQFAHLDGSDPETALFAIAAGAPTASILFDDLGDREVGL